MEWNDRIVEGTRTGNGTATIIFLKKKKRKETEKSFFKNFDESANNYAVFHVILITNHTIIINLKYFFQGKKKKNYMCDIN